MACRDASRAFKRDREGERRRRGKVRKEEREPKRHPALHCCFLSMSRSAFAPAPFRTRLELIRASLSLSSAASSNVKKEREREAGDDRKRRPRKKEQIQNAPWKRLAASINLAAPLKVILGCSGAAAAAGAAPEVVGSSEPVMVARSRGEGSEKCERRRRCAGVRSFPLFFLLLPFSFFLRGESGVRKKSLLNLTEEEEKKHRILSLLSSLSSANYDQLQEARRLAHASDAHGDHARLGPGARGRGRPLPPLRRFRQDDRGEQESGTLKKKKKRERERERASAAALN